MRHQWQQRPEPQWPERLFWALCVAIILGAVASLGVVLWLFGVLIEWWGIRGMGSP